MMWRVLLLLSLTAVARGEVSQATKDAIDGRLTDLETSFYTVARQLMMQRLDFEEAMRSDGDSGIKQIRVHRDGNQVWYSASHVAGSTAAIHNHADLKSTCGMGEVEAVLNGVHFRTRHNDYKLVKPSTTNSDYHAKEDIAFPPVPPDVAAETDLNKAFQKMRSYFRAWQTGNDTALDYKPYFRPVLCYLEGAWTNDVDLDEPFDSDRHHLDAASWFDLQEKVRFTAYTGDKDQAENFAYLPTSIFNITDGQPVLAQWNYRILCHPVQGDQLQLKHLKPVDDLHSRMYAGDDLDNWLEGRQGRFAVHDESRDRAFPRGDAMMDRIMSQIPGKDNYMADITDVNLDMPKYDMRDNDQLLNAGFYHRYVFIKDKDAMGVQINKRGFADRSLYIAHTTQKRVVPVSLNQCDRRGENCYFSSSRVSYAIPLEVVWLTPLNSWNPLDLTDKGLHSSDEGQTVYANGRDGGLTADKAFNGTNSKVHFLTPSQFYMGGEVETDPADTVKGAVGVLDPQGNVRAVVASGIRVTLPEIIDVGLVRTRYPIFPIHAEGGTAYKDLAGLSKIVMDLNANLQLLHTVPQFGSNDTDDTGGKLPNADLTWYRMQTAPSVPRKEGGGTHIHYLDMRSRHALYAMDGCETYQIRTSLSKYHTHLLTVHFNSTSDQFEYIDCDGSPTCRDKHAIHLTPV